MPWIASDASLQARSMARSLLVRHPHDPLALGSALRRALPDLSAPQASAAADQATLGRLANERYGIDATDLLLTRDGLEQATRPEVAARRAALVSGSGAHAVVDLTAGLGFDARAFLATGLSVVAVERDPLTASFLTVNAPGARVVQGDAVDLVDVLLPALQPGDVVFIDPARRSGRRTGDGMRAHAERDPERWSPPWSFVVGLADRGVRVCAKVAPGLRPDQVPGGWSAVWTSVQREPVEAMVCSWALDAPRTACAIEPGTAGLEVAEVAGTGTSPTRLALIGAYLHEPDPALVAAELLDDLCASRPGLSRIDAGSAWLTSQEPLDHPLLRAFEVEAELPTDVKALRRELGQRGIVDVIIKGRGMHINADAMRRQLRLPGGPARTIIVTQAQGHRVTLLVHDHRRHGEH